MLGVWPSLKKRHASFSASNGGHPQTHLGSQWSAVLVWVFGRAWYVPMVTHSVLYKTESSYRRILLSQGEGFDIRSRNRKMVKTDSGQDCSGWRNWPIRLGINNPKENTANSSTNEWMGALGPACACTVNNPIWQETVFAMLMTPCESSFKKITQTCTLCWYVFKVFITYVLR